MRPLCIYHGGCDDGFGSTYVVNKYFDGAVDFHFGIYQDPPPDCTDREVLIVDFSYKREVMEEIAGVAEIVTVLDHHKSAEAELQPLLDSRLIEGEFDMNRSGAMMTWDFFYPATDPPWLLEYIQDRDLWRKELPDNNEVIMALRSYPQDFQVWASIIDTGRDALIQEGISIHR